MKYVRAATLQNFDAEARALGLDPEELLRRVALDAGDLRAPRNKIPANAVAALCNHGALISGCEDFALRLAAGSRLSVLGPLALLAYVEHTVRDALLAIIRFQTINTNAAGFHLEERGGLAYMRGHLVLEHNMPSRQAYEFLIATGHLALATLLGPGWQAVRVCFRHAPPRTATMHGAVFGPHLEFNSESDCIVIRSSDLDRPISSANPQAAVTVRHYLQSLEAPPGAGLRHDVRQIVDVLIVSGNCTAQAVAQRLGMPLRSFYLRLQQENVSFSGIVDEVRREVALRQLANGGISLTEVTGLLGFSSLPAFSRWFRQRFGCSARDWMARQATARRAMGG